MIAWRKKLTSDSLGGLAADERLVVVSGRDPLDQSDFYQAFDSQTGRRRWQILQPAPGELDYGNAPRATPLLLADRVILLGAFGHLISVAPESGEIQWRRDLQAEYPGELPTWGYCGSPLAWEGKLLLQTTAPGANLICLSASDGQELWRCGTEGIAYSSFVFRQTPSGGELIGYDAKSLGGWDAATGKRLWTLRPRHTGDFHVPTPLIQGQQLWLSTENNGTRRYELAATGPAGEPAAAYAELAPDTHSPVLLGERLLGIWNGLHCLEATTLQPVWTNDADEYGGYGSIIGAGTRALILTQSGDLILIDTAGTEYRELGRCRLGTDDSIETHAHPALVGRRLFVRYGRELLCLDLE
ncbi:MAG: PQQ-binding-like beta-propeller repeat protein [Planctomycetota bacterium]